MVRLGILQCDGLDRPHVDVDGDYDELFATLLRRHDIALTTYRADLGSLPRTPRDCDAWLVSGSRHSVFDDVEWITALHAFVARVLDDGRPLVGVCFGHQLVADVLGAPVERATVGWSVGAVDYRVVDRPAGDADRADFVRLLASHQDQVVALPSGTTLLMTAPSCPIAGFAGGSVLTVQAHPEFTPALARSLYRARATLLGHDVVAAAIESLDRPLDHERVAGWIAAFVTGPTAS